MGSQRVEVVVVQFLVDVYRVAYGRVIGGGQGEGEGMKGGRC